MEVVNGKIMLQMHSLKFNNIELAVIGRILEDIQQKHPKILEVTSVDREGTLFFIEAKELDPRCDMYHPIRIDANFVIDTKNNKWGTFKEVTNPMKQEDRKSQPLWVNSYIIA